MNRTEHLLTTLAEECAEVAQRCSKAARFGLSEVQPGQDLTNAQRILQEWYDAIAVLQMLIADGALPVPASHESVLAKKEKVERFLVYSAQCGTLTP